MNSPLAYFITFTTYGTWLHGNKAGSIWKENSNTKLIDVSPELENAEVGRLKNPPFVLDADQRQNVLEAILEVCCFRNWDAFAVHVRTNHVHAVISAKATSEKIMNDLKAYASRALKNSSAVTLPKKIWTRHGSTRYLWDQQALSEAVKYTKNHQGNIMAFAQQLTKPRP